MVTYPEHFQIPEAYEAQRHGFLSGMAANTLKTNLIYQYFLIYRTDIFQIYKIYQRLEESSEILKFWLILRSPFGIEPKVPDIWSALMPKKKNKSIGALSETRS